MLQRFKSLGVTTYPKVYVFLILFGKFVSAWKAYNSSIKWHN